MDNGKMGRFISELRKSHQLTQKELAEKLNVSDKAVSKWERGLSCPDISLLSPLSDIFGITTTELLNGERASSDVANEDVAVATALEYGRKEVRRKTDFNLTIIAATLSVFLLLGIFVVSIVDLATSGTFSWSLIPISSSIFAWIVLIPTARLGARGIVWSLAAVSVLVLPFLYVLDFIIGNLVESNTMLFSVGALVAPLLIGFAWFAYFLLKKFRTRILLGIAILVLLSSPVNYFTNMIISNRLNEPFEGLALILNTFIPVIIAAILFAIEFVLRKNSTATN